MTLCFLQKEKRNLLQISYPTHSFFPAAGEKSLRIKINQNYHLEAAQTENCYYRFNTHKENYRLWMPSFKSSTCSSQKKSCHKSEHTQGQQLEILSMSRNVTCKSSVKHAVHTYIKTNTHIKLGQECITKDFLSQGLYLKCK